MASNEPEVYRSFAPMARKRHHCSALKVLAEGQTIQCGTSCHLFLVISSLMGHEKRVLICRYFILMKRSVFDNVCAPSARTNSGRCWPSRRCSAILDRSAARPCPILTHGSPHLPPFLLRPPPPCPPTTNVFWRVRRPPLVRRSRYVLLDSIGYHRTRQLALIQ